MDPLSDDLMISDNAFHSLVCFSTEEVQMYRYAAAYLKDLYEPLKGVVLPPHVLSFQATINMTTSCKAANGTTFVKVDVNAFRLHDKITDIGLQILKMIDSQLAEKKAVLNDQLDQVVLDAIDDVAGWLLIASMFRTGAYEGLLKIKINSGLRTAPPTACIYALPAVVFVLAHEFMHQMPERHMDRRLILQGDLPDYDHILHFNDLGIGVDPHANFDDGFILYSQFKGEEIRELPQAIITEINCDISAASDTYAALRKLPISSANILEAISWATGIELLLALGDVMVRKDPPASLLEFRNTGLRDLILVVYFMTIARTMVHPQNHSKWFDSVAQVLNLRRFVIFRIIHSMLTQRKTFFQSVRRPSLSEIHSAAARYEHDAKTRRMLILGENIFR